MKAGALVALILLGHGLSGIHAQGPPRGQPGTVYLMPGSHLDLGFTAPLSVVRQQRIQILDMAIDAAERDPGFVWFEEGGWSVDAWLDQYRADPARIARLRALVVSGRIGVGATLLSAHGAAFPAALALLTIHLDRIQRELGKRPTVAVLNDVPSAPEAMIDALAAAGIHYLLSAPNLNFTPPMPAFLVQRPFYWQAPSGSRVLVFIDTDGYSAGLLRWGLPPSCARMANPRRFPEGASDQDVFDRGVRAELARRPPDLPVTLVQHAFDNWSPECAARLPDAVREWNAQRTGTRIVLATPDVYFHDIETRIGAQLPVRRGEWGGDWDRLRATEPVWSWRLRQAMAAVTPSTPYATRRVLATVLDHNVGLGPRWEGDLTQQQAAQHVTEVAALYRQAVTATLGAAGANAVPPALPRPPAAGWPDSWRAISGGVVGVARVRIGPGFPHRAVDDSLTVVDLPLATSANSARLVVHVRMDRPALDARAGPRYRAVIEVRLDRPIDSLRIAPADSPDAIAGRWLLGAPPPTIVSPAGVRVTGPHLSLDARGPLLIDWSLARDRSNPRVTWLQAVAFLESLDGDAAGGVLRAPFASLYPGEPAVTDFDMEVVRVAH